MTKRKMQQEVPEVTVLKKPREVLKKELMERIAIGKDLCNRQVTTIQKLEELKKDYSSWDDFNEELLRRSFSKINNEYHSDYISCSQWIGLDDMMLRRNTNSGEYQLSHEKKKINASIINLERLVDKLPLIEESDSLAAYTTTERTFTNTCFIVHGHNDARKFEVARFIENDLRRKTIILHEQPNKGRTIIEKFEDYSKVDFAVALWTADDEGKSKAETALKFRARQNVIFETAFFIGKLGRENVVVLYEDGVEIPSDYSGVIFLRLVDNWKDDLRREVDAIYEF